MVLTSAEQRTRGGSLISLLQAIAGQQITLYGDGMQVRDVLFVEDLVDAMILAQRQCNAGSAGERSTSAAGRANVMSLLELLEIVGELEGRLLRCGSTIGGSEINGITCLTLAPSSP